MTNLVSQFFCKHRITWLGALVQLTTPKKEVGETSSLNLKHVGLLFDFLQGGWGSYYIPLKLNIHTKTNKANSNFEFILNYPFKKPIIFGIIHLKFPFSKPGHFVTKLHPPNRFNPTPAGSDALRKLRPELQLLSSKESKAEADECHGCQAEWPFHHGRLGIEKRSHIHTLFELKGFLEDILYG